MQEVQSELRVPCTARRSNQSVLKEISPEYSLKGLMLKLKLQYFGPPDVKNRFIGKDPDAEKDWRQEEKGMTEDEMVGWHHWLNGHEFKQALGVCDGQGNLVCCSPWDCKESDVTEWLNWIEHTCAKVRTVSSFASRGKRCWSRRGWSRSAEQAGVCVGAILSGWPEHKAVFSLCSLCWDWKCQICVHAL